jgi:hypothetical protein
LNLRDIRSSLQIIIAERPGSECGLTRQAVARAVPNAIVVAMTELAALLAIIG